MTDRLIGYTVDLGYAESDRLFAIHTLHQAVGDALKILGTLEDGSRNELSADGNDAVLLAPDEGMVNANLPIRRIAVLFEDTDVLLASRLLDNADNVLALGQHHVRCLYCIGLTTTVDLWP